MGQTPNKKRGLPKGITQCSDSELMEKVFGKRIMKAVGEVVSERSESTDEKEENPSMRGT